MPPMLPSTIPPLARAALLAAVLCLAAVLAVLFCADRRPAAQEAFEQGGVGHHDAALVRRAYGEALGRMPTPLEAQDYGRLVALGHMDRRALRTLLRATREYAVMGPASVRDARLARKCWREGSSGREPETAGDLSRCMQMVREAGFDGDAVSGAVKEHCRAEDAEVERLLRAPPSDAAPRTDMAHVSDDAALRRALQPSAAPAATLPCKITPYEEADEVVLSTAIAQRDRDLQRIQCLRSGGNTCIAVASPTSSGEPMGVPSPVSQEEMGTAVDQDTSIGSILPRFVFAESGAATNRTMPGGRGIYCPPPG